MSSRLHTTYNSCWRHRCQWTTGTQQCAKSGSTCCGTTCGWRWCMQLMCSSTRAAAALVVCFVRVHRLTDSATQRICQARRACVCSSKRRGGACWAKMGNPGSALLSGPHACVVYVGVCLCVCSCIFTWEDEEGDARMPAAALCSLTHHTHTHTHFLTQSCSCTNTTQAKRMHVRQHVCTWPPTCTARQRRGACLLQPRWQQIMASYDTNDTGSCGNDSQMTQTQPPQQCVRLGHTGVLLHVQLPAKA